MSVEEIPDNGGRRFEIERRQFSFTIHIPERRCGKDRRCDADRRNARYLHGVVQERRDSLFQ